MHFEKALKKESSDYLKILTSIVKKCDKDLEESPIENMHSGSTLNLVLILDNTIYVSNTGDSRAILVTSKCVV